MSALTRSLLTNGVHCCCCCYQVRSSGGNLQAYVQVNAKAQFEKQYWKGVLDAQGKADGGYY